MKKQLLLTAFILFMSGFLWAQTQSVKIIFDVTSKDTAVHKTAIYHATIMAAAYPQSKFEMVIYGGALAMVLKDKSIVENGIKKLKENKNVSFKVCAVTMDRNNVKQSQLIPGIEVVPDAIMEIAIKQGEGWAYIKESHN